MSDDSFDTLMAAVDPLHVSSTPTPIVTTFLAFTRERT